jgi:diaminohydroxyphosphoribosylaminopyrimidine deaminase/5-amino-6-(5-phosphoribosylamino)uracil reductase
LTANRDFSGVMMEQSDNLMRRALRLARRGRGWVEPNPMVGAVLVRDGVIVAQGWHHQFGGPHAEVNCLRDAQRRGIDPRGATMVVTLEPCCHTGKTPPCTRALIQAGVGEVIVAMTDPSPHAAGGGLEELRSAGIAVRTGVCEADALQLNAPFVKRVTRGLPWVIAKWAQTLDGKIATAAGDSKWISNEKSRQIVHELRARVDAIMVGVNTALADDPALTARGVRIHRRALRIVVDPHHRLPAAAAMLHDDGPPVIRADGDIEGLLRRLVTEHGATNVLVEGGATLIGSMLRDGLVDEVIAFVAPKILGDGAGLGAVTGLSIQRIAEATPLHLSKVKRVGDDVMLRYRVRGTPGH